MYMTKMTQKLALEIAISALVANPNKEYRPAGTEDVFSADDAIEKLTAMVVALEKKAAAPKKPTSKQTENAELKQMLIAELSAAGKAMTISEMIKELPSCAGLTPQKVTAVIRDEIGKTIKKDVVKRTSYFEVIGG